jgi:RNA polymerase sigma-70 factor, ECF subfamily
MANERPGHVLQATALVNEAYLRLVDWKQVQWRNRAHFFGVAAQLMRRILADAARARRRAKRGGGVSHVTVSEALEVPATPSTDLVALDDALKTLERLDVRQGRVVELRFFWWLEPGRNGPGARRIGRHRPSRLEHGTGLVVRELSRRADT